MDSGGEIEEDVPAAHNCRLSNKCSLARILSAFILLFLDSEEAGETGGLGAGDVASGVVDERVG